MASGQPDIDQVDQCLAALWLFVGLVTAAAFADSYYDNRPTPFVLKVALVIIGVWSFYRFLGFIARLLTQGREP
jgi:lipopolysaccharide export LptBFGC system permease protein LptF